MTLKILNKISFCKKFLEPISKISTACILTVSNDLVSSLCKGDDGTFLYAETVDVSFVGEERKLNIPDLARFIKMFDCIQEEQVELIINSNNIEYKSASTRFKYHLIDDGIIQVANLSVKKIEASNFCTFFKVPISLLSSIIKGSSYVDSEKLYIHTENGLVLGDLNDKKRSNVDSFGLKLSDSFTGEEVLDPVPFSVELFRSVSTLKLNELEVKLNLERRIIAFSIDYDNYILKYFATGLVG
jgi:hypothetical protein